MEAEVVIRPEARPMTKREAPRLQAFQDRAEPMTPTVITISPRRSTLRKPKRLVRRPRNSRLIKAPSI